MNNQIRSSVARSAATGGTFGEKQVREKRAFNLIAIPILILPLSVCWGLVVWLAAPEEASHANSLVLVIQQIASVLAAAACTIVLILFPRSHSTSPRKSG